MDIISLAKAGKALRDTKNLQNNIIGKKAESYFKSVDARLDWLDAQTGSLTTTAIYNLLTEDATFINTELVNGTLKLKPQTITHPMYSKSYQPIGTYEKTFDLKGSFGSILSSQLIKAATANQTAKVEIATSQNNSTYSAFYEWNTNNLPTERYLKVKITLVSNDKITINYESPVKFESNENITDTNLLRTNKEYEIIKDLTWMDTGSLHRQKIILSEWMRVDKINRIEVV